MADILRSLEEKEKGNAAYKQKDFETAIKHYSAAIELDPKNITFRTNLAAVFFEQGQFEECIKQCEEAIEIGRENRVEYTHIAKAYARIGNAYFKQEKYPEALVNYNKSLSENRTQDIAQKARECEKLMTAAERLAYIDPEKALEEKQKGNDFFKQGKYPDAMKHYTEAIKRNPDDAKIYSNRAACYTKLLEFNLAMKDSEACIRLDPAFVKGYLRKAGSLFGLKKFDEAGKEYRKAMEIDSKCQEAIDGYRKCVVQEDPESVRQRAMNDPEVQQILGDPAMQLILQQMQKDPKALQEHLKNPAVAAKMEKLMSSGLIAFR